jgi:hypothetical protein
MLRTRLPPAASLAWRGTRRRLRRFALPLAALAALAPLAGCGSFLTQGTADAAGIAGAGIAGAVSKNATVGAAIGLGVASVANAGLMYEERRVHRRAQDSIAAAAGVLPDGGVAPWQVVHTIPIEVDQHGEVAVSRTISGTDFSCKEIVFSVDEGSGAKLHRAFYTGYVCRDGDTWHWATAEPATERWGSLQ